MFACINLRGDEFHACFVQVLCIICLFLGIRPIHSVTMLIVSVMFSLCSNGWRCCKVHICMMLLWLL